MSAPSLHVLLKPMAVVLSPSAYQASWFDTVESAPKLHNILTQPCVLHLRNEVLTDKQANITHTTTMQND